MALGRYKCIGDIGTRFYIILSGSCGVYKTHSKQTQEKVGNEEFRPKNEKEKPSEIEKNFETPIKRESKISRMSVVVKNQHTIHVMKSLTKDKVNSPTLSHRSSVPSSFKNEEKTNLHSQTQDNTEPSDTKLESLGLIQIGNKLLSQEKILPAGSAFGEIALMENVRRKATIIARQESHLAYLDKEHFDKILSNVERDALIF